MTHLKFKTSPYIKSINSVVDELINGFPVFFNDGVSSLSKQVYVPVNIFENVENYSLEVIAPGFEKSDFKVSLEDKILTIAVSKKLNGATEAETSTKGKQLRKEYSYPDFKRSFTIDEKIDATGIEASYVNGVLTLNLPKRKEVKEETKEITIN